MTRTVETYDQGVLVGTRPDLLDWSPSRTGFVSPLAFGGIGDGRHDDTAAIEAAWAALEATGQGILAFSPGIWTYNGSGIDPSTTAWGCLGCGPGITELRLAPTSRMFDVSGVIGMTRIEGFTVRGGAGLLRSRYEGNNIAGQRIFRNLHLKDYTGCAIEVASQNSPYWRVVDVLFNGADFAETIGFAHAGMANGSSIRDCSFIRNRASVKLGLPQDVRIRDSDFFRSSTQRPKGGTVDIWVVPGATQNLGGDGMLVDGCKFGVENLLSGDRRVLYASESDGARFGSRFPSEAVGTGYIEGHTYRSCKVRGSGAVGATPFIYSTTPRVHGVQIDNVWVGEPPSHLLEFATGIDEALLVQRNVAGQNVTPSSDAPVSVSNHPAAFR